MWTRIAHWDSGQGHRANAFHLHLEPTRYTAYFLKNGWKLEWTSDWCRLPERFDCLEGKFQYPLKLWTMRICTALSLICSSFKMLIWGALAYIPHSFKLTPIVIQVKDACRTRLKPGNIPEKNNNNSLQIDSQRCRFRNEFSRMKLSRSLGAHHPIWAIVGIYARKSTDGGSSLLHTLTTKAVAAIARCQYTYFVCARGARYTQISPIRNRCLGRTPCRRYTTHTHTPLTALWMESTLSCFFYSYYLLIFITCNFEP